MLYLLSGLAAGWVAARLAKLCAAENRLALTLQTALVFPAISAALFMLIKMLPPPLGLDPTQVGVADGRSTFRSSMPAATSRRPGGRRGEARADRRREAARGAGGRTGQEAAGDRKSDKGGLSKVKGSGNRPVKQSTT